MDDIGDSVQAQVEQSKTSVPAQTNASTQKAKDGAPPVEKAGSTADATPRPAPVGPQPHTATPRPSPVGPQPHAAAPRSAPVGPQPHTSAEIHSGPIAPQPHTTPRPEEEKSAPIIVNISDARRPAAADGQDGVNAPSESEAVPVATPAPEAPVEPASVTYTPDMSVKEICQRMTLEQAQNFKVPDGLCEGWTLAQVAKDRPSSLRWLKDVSLSADNELKAAATIVLNDLELKLAG